VVSDDKGNLSVNLHIFAEPWTFHPLATKPFPDAVTIPFNALTHCLGADDVRMKPPGKSGGSFATAIDPGSPIAGLPEPEKLTLSQRTAYKRAGALATRPYNCGGVVCQVTVTKQVHLAQPPLRAFALPRNNNPTVLASPRVAVVYWGAEAADPRVGDKIRQILNLAFIRGALAEYGVGAPEFAGSFAYPEGNRQRISDAHTAPATVTDSDISHGLAGLIAAGKAPAPHDPNLVFLIVAAPEASSDTPGVRGGHNYFYLDGDAGRVPVHYGWALWGQPDSADSLALIDQLTWTLSHELLEACTDPEPPNGWLFEGPEICDVAAGLHGKVDGIVVTGYFSHRDGRFKLPVEVASA
jgi:hypothetical protein